MPMSGEEITARIKAVYPQAEITLTDLAGDNDHWQVTVKTLEFQGKTRVQQHKMVMDAFGADMGTTLHALSVKTLIP